MSLDLCRSLDEYLTRYGTTLGKTSMDRLVPLHNEATDPPADNAQFGLELFEPQAHVVAAASKMLDEMKCGNIVGEMGTGKTVMGAATVHNHAKGEVYTALVMCPDHLIDKWEREIKSLIPNADVHTFENWKSCIRFMSGKHVTKRQVAGQPKSKPKFADVCIGVDDQGNPIVETREVKTSGIVHQERVHWTRPMVPQWFIVGRNQSKWNPDWEPIGEHEDRHKLISRTIKTGSHPVVDENGKLVKKQRPDGSWTTVYKASSKRAAFCPRCGTTIINKDGDLVDPEDIQDRQTHCKGWIMRQISGEDPRHNPSGTKEHKPGGWKYQGLDIITSVTHGVYGDRILPNYTDKAKPGKIVSYSGKKYVMDICNEPLWQWTGHPYRWPPAKLIQKKMRCKFKYLIVDEIHEEKSSSSAQSMAAGKLMAAADHVIALTGTLIGGYAHHLFPLLVRMQPKAIVIDEEFQWNQETKFAQRYGRVNTIITEKIGGDGDDGVIVGRRQSAMGRQRASATKQNKRTQIAPGVMPQLFGRHLLGCSVFLSLDEMDSTLPRLIDYEIDDPEDPEYPGAGPHSCEMDVEMEAEYKRIEKILEAANKELLKKGSMRLLGATLHTLLDYTDRPYDYNPKYPAGLYQGIDYKESWAVGYHATSNDKRRATWVDVVQPADLDRNVLRDKEAKLIEICLRSKMRKQQSWVYCQMTGKRDVMPRLKSILEERGLKVLILRSETVPLRDRERWIYENGKNVDVVISHPKLVETGLDLFDKGGNHNFNSLIFYQTGYNLFTLRQAARRAWRIGQKFDCPVHYLFYAGTMQERAMALMGKKLQAAESIDGKFSTEGLIAMAGEENAQIALARSLEEKLVDQRRVWNRFGEEQRKAVIKTYMAMKPVVAKHETVELILGDHVIPETFAESVDDNVNVIRMPDPDMPTPEEIQAVADAISQNDDDDFLNMSEDDLDSMFESLAKAGVSLAELEF